MRLGDSVKQHGVVFYLSAVTGMWSLWILLRAQMYTIFFTVTMPDMGVGQQSYYFYLGIMALLGVAAVLLRRPLETRLLGSRAFLIAVSGAGTLGAIVEYVAGTSYPAFYPLYLLGMAVLAGATLFLLLSWSVLIARIDIRSGVTCSVLGFAFSFIYTFIPPVTYTMLVACTPILSGALRCLCGTDATSVADARSSVRAASGNPVTSSAGIPPQVDMRFGTLGNLPIGLIATLILFMIFGSVIRGVLYAGSIQHTHDLMFLEDMISMGFSLLLLLIIWLFKWNRRSALIIWLVLSTLLFVGLFVAALAGQNKIALETAIIIPARTLLVFFLWLVLVLETGGRKESTVLALIIIYLGAELLSSVVTYVVMPQYAVRLSEFVGDYFTAITIIVTFMLIVGSMFFLGNIAMKASAPASRDADGDRTGSVVHELTPLELCEKVAPEYGLTPRETQIMALIAQGHSFKKIAELLVLSPATVQSHSKNIYAKLGVHDRQSIIDMVDEMKTREG